MTIATIEVVALNSSQDLSCYHGRCSHHGKIYIGRLEGLCRVACKYAIFLT